MHSCVRTHKGEIKHENYIYINNCMMNIQNKHAGQEYIAPACRIILLKGCQPLCGSFGSSREDVNVSNFGGDWDPEG